MSEESLESMLPSDGEIVGAVISTSSVVFDVPDKAEIFRQADLVSDENPYAEQVFEFMPLRILSPTPFSSFEVAHPPFGEDSWGVVEHNYAVKLQVVSKEMVLTRIRVIYGSRTDDSKAIVFEGDEYPGPAWQRQFRGIRIAVDERGWSTYEVMWKTKILTNGNDI